MYKRQDDILAFAHQPYPVVVADVLSRFLTDYTLQELLAITERGYAAFDAPEPPLVPLDRKGLFALELFHGPTLAFKDYALCVLPGLLGAAMKKQGMEERALILVATSGDTGKAAMAGFADWPGTAVCVYYPRDGVSAVQRAQMRTQKGENLTAIGLEGSFDQCQTGVKKLMADEALQQRLLEMGYRFSSANSINFGRLAPQVAYSVSYTHLDVYKRQVQSLGGECDETKSMHLGRAVFVDGIGGVCAKDVCAHYG